MKVRVPVCLILIPKFNKIRFFKELSDGYLTYIFSIPMHMNQKILCCFNPQFFQLTCVQFVIFLLVIKEKCFNKYFQRTNVER